MTERKTNIQFPCRFPIKVIGKARSDVEKTALSIIKHHSPNFDGSIERRPSRDDAYIALTFTIEAESQSQLDAIYMALSECHDVIMAL